MNLPCLEVSHHEKKILTPFDSGICFEYISIGTKNANGTSSYVCEFDGFTFIDDNDYLQSERCYQN